MTRPQPSLNIKSRVLQDIKSEHPGHQRLVAEKPEKAAFAIIVTSGYPDLANPKKSAQVSRMRELLSSDPTDAWNIGSELLDQEPTYWPLYNEVHVAYVRAFGEQLGDPMPIQILLDGIDGVNRELANLSEPAETVIPVTRESRIIEFANMHFNFGDSCYSAASQSEWDRPSLLTAANAFLFTSLLHEYNPTSTATYVAWAQVWAAAAFAKADENQHARKALLKARELNEEWTIGFITSARPQLAFLSKYLND